MRINKGDLSHRMTLRLNDDQMQFLVYCSESCGCTPSEYVRMMINASMVALKRTTETIEKEIGECLMRTSKPISTISYNSPEFLTLKLNEWMKKGLVAYWCFILHKGETLDDGTVEKDHIHVFIEPNKTVDTLSLQYDFKRLMQSIRINHSSVSTSNLQSMMNGHGTYFTMLTT